MIHTTKCVRGFLCAVCLMGLVSVTHVGVLGAAEPRAGAWAGGAAIGFLGNTPNGTAFATNFVASQDTLLPFLKSPSESDGSYFWKWNQSSP